MKSMNRKRVYTVIIPITVMLGCVLHPTRPVIIVGGLIVLWTLILAYGLEGNLSENQPD